MGGRNLVMSDIHGMYEALQQLLSGSGYNPVEDTLTVLGDYIDRGHDSRQVMEFFMDLKASHGDMVTLLKGNHEDLCLKALRGDKQAHAGEQLLWLASSGDETLRSFGGKIPDEVISFMEAMPVYAETEQYIFVHAGVHPSLPLSEVNPHDMLWSSSCMPHVSGKMVIVGHVIRDEVTYLRRANTLYIDTGAFKSVWSGTGRLSMADLTNRKVHWVNTGGRNDGQYEERELRLDHKS